MSRINPMKARRTKLPPAAVIQIEAFLAESGWSRNRLVLWLIHNRGWRVPAANLSRWLSPKAKPDWRTQMIAALLPGQLSLARVPLVQIEVAQAERHLRKAFRLMGARGEVLSGETKTTTEGAET